VNLYLILWIVQDVPNPYTFAYDVKDDHYNNMGHSESSDGKGHASGSYHVYLPDGRTQTVTYKADPYVIKIELYILSFI